MQFARSAFGQFMASMSGRILRVTAGLLLIAWGGTLLGSYWGPALIAIGLVPLLAGLFDVCVVSVLFGGPFSGQRIRECRV